MNSWTNRLLLLLIFLVSASTGLQLAILHRLLPTPVPVARSPREPTTPVPSQPSVRHSAIGSVIELSGLQTQGDNTSRIAVVEFSDYECPFCANYAASVLQPLREKFIKTGKVRYALSHLPLPSHANAKLLAAAAICAGQQGHYWEMHDELFRALPKKRDAILSLARDLHLKTDAFSVCLEGSNASQQIELDLQRAQALGVIATPTFLIGPIDEKDRVTVDWAIEGAHALTTFETTISEALAKNAR